MRRAVDEKCRYYEPSGKAEKFLHLLDRIPVGSHNVYIFILRSGNRFGKSALGSMLAGYLSERFSNPYLDCIPYLRRFPRPSRGRIYTTANAAEITYQEELLKWLPRPAYKGSKEGHSYLQRFKFNGGSEFDIFTFDQDPQQGESINLSWAIVDEPMSRRHWGALKSRFTMGGVIFLLLTPLEGAGWYHDELETPERLGTDVFAMQAHTEDACVIHGVRGHLPHEYNENIKKEFDEDEREARLNGGYLYLSGRIYKVYSRETHEFPELMDYWSECWEKGKWSLYNIIDPHDRKPFAIGWYAVFPNDDVITIAEYPDQPFHKLTSSSLSTKDYAKIIKATEEELGRPAQVRLIDPNFGNSPKKGGASVKQEFAELGLLYSDPPDAMTEGHIAVKTLLGKPADNIRPKFYVLSHCINHSYGMSHYAYSENRDERKGLSEIPELVHKDFADLVRYGALYGFKYQEEPKPFKLWKPRIHKGSTYRGA